MTPQVQEQNCEQSIHYFHHLPVLSWKMEDFWSLLLRVVTQMGEYNF